MMQMNSVPIKQEPSFKHINNVSIEEEYRRNSALKNEDIEELRKWCQEKNHPPCADSDLAIFLHASYYYVETAKLNIDNYYTTRESLPQIFENRTVHSENVQNILDTVAIIPLEKRTREGYVVILIRPLGFGQNKLMCNDLIKVFNMVLDLSIHEEGTQNGYVFVIDVHGANFINPNSFDLNTVKKYFQYLQKTAPIRWFGVHLINTLLPFEQDYLFTRMSIVRNDYADAIFFHSDLDSLNEIVPLKALPNEMGGEAGFVKDLHAAQVQKLNHKSFSFLLIDLHDTMRRQLKELKTMLSACFRGNILQNVQ